MRESIRFLPLLALAACCPADVGAAGIPVDGYAAVVNDRVITIGEVMNFVKPIEDQLRMNYEGVDLQLKMEQAFEAGLNSMIERALILESFEEEEGQIPEKLVDDHIKQIIQDRFGNDRAAFLKTLEEEQLTTAEWREQIKEGLIIMLLRRREVIDRVQVSPTAVRKAYENDRDKYFQPAKVHLRMIVLQKGESEEDHEVKRREAENILAKLKAGEDFALLARSVSEGSKAVRGGDWGWMQPGELREELAEVAGRLETGAVSDVIEAGESYYILKVEARKNEAMIPFEEVKAKIEKELIDAQEEKLYQDWIARLKNQNYVRIYETK
jgi:parvulin-like peptidyl-prolyl isomerase